MRHALFPVGATALLALAPAARAADCAAPYAVDQLLGDLGTIDAALRDGDDATAGKAAIVLEQGLGCLNEVLPRMIVGRTYRAVGAGLVSAGKAERGEDWLRTAAEIEQSFDFGIEDLPESHPVRAVYAQAKNSSSGEELAVVGKAFAEGVSYLDGKKVTEPKARGDRLHLYQYEREGLVRSWVIDGNAFPGEVLVAGAVAVAEVPDDAGKPGKPPKEPKAAKEPKAPKDAPPKDEKVAGSDAGKPPKPAPVAVTSDGKMVVQRERPAEKIPLLIGGGAVMLGAGGVYYASFVKRKQFDESNSLSEIQDLQPQVNRLFIASLAVLGVGAGTFTWGVIVDGGTPLPAVQVRF